MDSSGLHLKCGKQTGLLKEWPKDGPPIAWKIKGLGGGDSTPSVADNGGNGGGYLACLDFKTGEVLWKE